MAAPPLVPGRIVDLADQQRRVRARPWPELLHPAASHRRQIQVLLLVHADPVHAEERARPCAQPAPGVDQIALAIELRQLLADLVEHPHAAIRIEEDEVQVDSCRARLHLPHPEERAILVEDLDATVAAVVDWEISTLGDPLADLAYALNFFPDPTDEIPMAEDAPTMVPGFPTRTELGQRYANKTGRDLSLLDYYVGFNRWKSACIVHGVYARYMAGMKSTEGIDMEALRLRIDGSLTLSEQAVSRL